LPVPPLPVTTCSRTPSQSVSGEIIENSCLAVSFLYWRL
jgi:hypothetical protein